MANNGMIQNANSALQQKEKPKSIQDYICAPVILAKTAAAGKVAVIIAGGAQSTMTGSITGGGALSEISMRL